MNIFRKEKKPNGRCHLYLFGFKIFSYEKIVSVINYTKEQLDMDIAKYCGLVKNKDAFQTLVLGSSHARNGFLPIDGEFNLGLSSQDLYRSYHLYKWIVKNKFHLENIILFYSVFHPGLQLEKTKEAWKCIPYKYLYNIRYAYHLPKYLQNMERDAKVYCKSANLNVSSSYKGEDSYDETMFSPSEITAKELVEKHLKNNRRNNNQNKYLVNMIKIARKNHHNMYIVTPPYRQDYRSYLPDYNEVHKELLNIVKMFPNVKILNFQNDEDFNDGDFKDSDHLNKKGAIKLSAKIREKIGK